MTNRLGVQLSLGVSMWSMTTVCTGLRAGSNFRPSCSCSCGKDRRRVAGCGRAVGAWPRLWCIRQRECVVAVQPSLIIHEAANHAATQRPRQRREEHPSSHYPALEEERTATPHDVALGRRPASLRCRRLRSGERPTVMRTLLDLRSEPALADGSNHVTNRLDDRVGFLIVHVVSALLRDDQLPFGTT